MYNTFHASYPFLRWPLDHLFHSDHFAVVNLARLPAFGSDHFPILVEIAFVKNLDREQEGLTPDEGDLEWAAEKTGAEGAARTMCILRANEQRSEREFALRY